MPLRKTTSLTDRRLDANRRNAQQSTGPRSQAGKERMKMNALKHGCEAAPENEAAVMRALGEEPERFAALQRDLATSYGPGDALWARQLDDLARLTWRRERLERMQTGQMRRDLEAVEERWRVLRRSVAEVSFDASQCDAVGLELLMPTHPTVRRRLRLSLWGVIREQVRGRVFRQAQQTKMEPYYREELGWRPRRIGYLLMIFGGWATYRREQRAAFVEAYFKKHFGDEAGFEARYQELGRLLDEQIAAEEAAFAEEWAAEERKYAIEHDECLAPEGKIWEMLLRQEAGLDRAIDRKVRILLAMRREEARMERDDARTARTGAPGRAPAPPAGPADDQPHDTSSAESLRLGLRGTSAGQSETLPAAGTKPLTRLGPAGESAGPRHPLPTGEGCILTEARAALQTAKSPEQSQNVIENKGSAVEATA